MGKKKWAQEEESGVMSTSDKRKRGGEEDSGGANVAAKRWLFCMMIAFFSDQVGQFPFVASQFPVILFSAGCEPTVGDNDREAVYRIYKMND